MAWCGKCMCAAKNAHVHTARGLCSHERPSQRLSGWCWAGHHRRASRTGFRRRHGLASTPGRNRASGRPGIWIRGCPRMYTTPVNWTVTGAASVCIPPLDVAYSVMLTSAHFSVAVQVPVVFAMLPKAFTVLLVFRATNLVAMGYSADVTDEAGKRLTGNQSMHMCVFGQRTYFCPIRR